MRDLFFVCNFYELLKKFGIFFIYLASVVINRDIYVTPQRRTTMEEGKSDQIYNQECHVIIIIIIIRLRIEE